MRIVVTGGSGFLGARTVTLLAAAGHQVVSVDSTPSRAPGVEWQVADLRRREAPYGFLRGAEAVIHLANHSNALKTDAQTVLAENTAINTNVFQAAVELGVRRLVFASSIQAMSGGPLVPEGGYPAPPARRLPALPIDGSTPAHAGNAYGQSKIFGELLLAHHVERSGVEGVALRFPYLARDPRRMRPWIKPDCDTNLAELYGWLWVEDAARLLLACATAASLPGFRIYHPVGPLPPDWPDAETLAATHFPDAPRRRPGEKLSAFVDISALVRELGWTPTGWERFS